jgi:hypothetical protein
MRPIEEDELLAVLKHAREKNKRLGITGMLIHCDGSFIQALKGSKDQVMIMLRIIRQDSRHSRIVVLFEGPIQTGVFLKGLWVNRPSKEKNWPGARGIPPNLDLGDDAQAIKNFYSCVALKLIVAFRALFNKKSSVMER